MILPEDHHIPPGTLRPFATVTSSMFTLFRVMTGAPSGEEEEAIDWLMQTIPSIKFGFVFFMVTSSWTLLSILTAVVSESMIQTTEEQNTEERIGQADMDRKALIDELKAMFSDIHEKGAIAEKEIEEVSKGAVEEKIKKCARLCELPARDVVEVLKSKSCEGWDLKDDEHKEKDAQDFV